MVRRLAVVLVALVASAVPAARATTTPPAACGPRALVLAAMPLELQPLLRETEIDHRRTVTIEGRTFYAGKLGGKDVVLAMTGIGLENARITTKLAYAKSRCPFTATLFSGVAGSTLNIGDVAIPESWTFDEGPPTFPADPALLAKARAVDVELSDTVPVGDDACLCPEVETLSTPVAMPQPAKLVVGGEGTSADMFSGRVVPCLPGGGDVAGCSPCLPGAAAAQAQAFAEHAPPLLDGEFLQGFFQRPPATTDRYAAQDMETAAVAAVARRYRVPFLGIRAVSDGPGDPLHLPGFPFQFFAYRHLAGNNAALVTEAVLAEL